MQAERNEPEGIALDFEVNRVVQRGSVGALRVAFTGGLFMAAAMCSCACARADGVDGTKAGIDARPAAADGLSRGDIRMSVDARAAGERVLESIAVCRLKPLCVVLLTLALPPGRRARRSPWELA